ncbi:hypothetical protein ACF0H5_011583 [Mactra antiquata]
MKGNTCNAHSTSFIKYGLTVLLCVSVGTFLLMQTSSGRKFLAWSYRTTLITTLTQRQIEYIYSSKCLIRNNYLTNTIDADICELCETVDKFETVSRNTDILMNLVHLDVPVIYYTGETDDDDSSNDDGDNDDDSNNMTVGNFVEQFLYIEELALFHPCQFSSNLKYKVTEHRDLLLKIHHKVFTSYYALWENCAQDALRAFRLFYNRPEFLDNSIQMTGSNWALICENFIGKRLKKMELYAPLEIILVVRGTVHVHLIPTNGCNETCTSLSHDLTDGETAIFTSTLHDLYIRPDCSKAETLVFGIGAYFD